MSDTERSTTRILIADDQADVLESLRLLLKVEHYTIEAARSPAGVLTALRESDFDVVLIDLNYARDTTSGKEGLDLLSRIQQLDDTLPVVVMTAWASVDLAVAAMRGGARDFVEKPWDNARLLSILRTQSSSGVRCDGGSGSRRKTDCCATTPGTPRSSRHPPRCNG